MRVGLLESGQRGQRPATLDEIIEQTRRAEALGLASMWFSNIFGHDAMTAAALAARVTTRIELGTAVTPTYPRHPYAMAQQAASTQAAARGRFTLGVGPSHRVVVEQMWGLSYDRAYSHTREYLSVLVPLLRTGEVDHSGGQFKVRARLTSADGRPVPVLLAGLGPKMLALAGRLADGTVTWMVGARTLRESLCREFLDVDVWRHVLKNGERLTGNFVVAIKCKVDQEVHVRAAVKLPQRVDQRAAIFLIFRPLDCLYQLLASHLGNGHAAG